MIKTMGSFPSAIQRGTCGIRAQAGASEATQIVRQLNAAFEDFRARNDRRVDEIDASVGDIARRLATAGLNGASGEMPVDPDYSTAFASYFRKGDAEAEVKAANAQGQRAFIMAAMSVGDNQNGGYLAPVEWDRRINKAQTDASPMRRLANVQTTSVGAFSTIWNDDSWGSGWVGETAARPATTTPGLASITFGHGEIYANPAITQRLLDDAQFPVEQWLADEVEATFARQEGVAFLAGNGANKPFGLLQYVPGGAAATQHPGGTLGISVSGNADTIPTADVLIDFAYSLKAPYRQNATWLMNSQTAATLLKMKDGDGNYIWRESLVVGQPATLLGYPVAIDEGMPNIAAGAIPIAFGDFKKGYLINDRFGVRVLRDPYTNKPFVQFYVTKRVGGGVLDPFAIRLLKVAAS